MSEFNFKSQICTSREQSERLLALGLKKETVDCYYWQENNQYGDGNGKWHLEVLDTKEAREHFEYLDKIFDDELFIPAWSLHRLIEMIQEVCPQVVIIFHRVDIRSNVKRIAYSFDVCDNIYDNIIDCIEWLIKEGYFNEEYLNKEE